MLTKSDLMAWRQCPRMLWLHHHPPEPQTSASVPVDRRTLDGRLVGEYARRDIGEYLWPNTSGDPASDAAAALAELTATAMLPAVEMPMVRDGLYARADALLPEAAGYVLRETKASTFPLKPDKATPSSPDEHHLDDVAVQAWVLEGAGLPLARAELNLLDNQWRYPGAGDYRGLFRQLDVTDAVQQRMHAVPQWLRLARDVIDGDMPDVRMGNQCTHPHPCPYAALCQRLEPPGPEHPLSLLPDTAGKALARKLAAKGYMSLLEPRPGELVGAQAALYRRIQHAHRTGRPILAPGADTFMQRLTYPRYYFDFEGIDLPVPRWVGLRPYEQVPFQWSCHIERAPGVFEHRAFLDLSGHDPSEPCIEEMLHAIDVGDGGPILVYYATYERGRIVELAKRHPAFADRLKRLAARLVDLHPVVKEHFYHPAMEGSFSIKKVLPVIAPDLNYGELDEVQDGTGAQVAYLQSCFDAELTPRRKAELRRNLLAYCEQDTWAMVEIGYFLEGKGRPTELRPPSFQV